MDGKSRYICWRHERLLQPKKKSKRSLAHLLRAAGAGLTPAGTAPLLYGGISSLETIGKSCVRCTYVPDGDTAYGRNIFYDTTELHSKYSGHFPPGLYCQGCFTSLGGVLGGFDDKMLISFGKLTFNSTKPDAPGREDPARTISLIIQKLIYLREFDSKLSGCRLSFLHLSKLRECDERQFERVKRVEFEHLHTKNSQGATGSSRELSVKSRTSMICPLCSTIPTSPVFLNISSTTLTVSAKIFTWLQCFVNFIRSGAKSYPQIARWNHEKDELRYSLVSSMQTSTT
ncbi:hypothetical protein C8J56DRAFT_316894 [Mycena floridula]|nr:hypothetical protein C8J56DRAFT_316894 [Mycena floridula]